MKWSDEAIILSARKHGENSVVARVFARGHGAFGGIVKGASSKHNRGVIQPGNIVDANWNARLSEHLGMFKLELLEANAALIMQDAGKLAALSSACAIFESSLPERHPYPRLYMLFQAFLGALKEGEDWPEAYVRLELDLLADTGFGLDLSRCAATGKTENLIYVSPKSGRAVSSAAGEPYKDKMLALPAFLLPSPRRGEGQGGGVSLTEKARELRKNMTEAESRLWYHLRAHRFESYGFRRQYPVEDRYIADFVCLEKMLIVELDGGQHADQQNYDNQRTTFLKKKGYRVLRFWNHEALENTEGALLKILETLENTPSLTLPRKREREQKKPPSGAETLAGMELTGYFLGSWLLEPHRRKLPAARGRLMEILKTHGAKT